MDGRRCSSAGQIICLFNTITKITHDRMGGSNAAFFICKKKPCIQKYTGLGIQKKKTANHLVCGLDVSDMIRTRDLLIRSQTLYPAELHSHIRFEQNIYYSKVLEMSSTF